MNTRPFHELLWLLPKKSFENQHFVMSQSAPETMGEYDDDFSGDVQLKSSLRRKSERRRRREKAELQIATMRAAAGMISSSDDETDDEDYDQYKHVKKSPKKHILGTLTKAAYLVRKNAKKGSDSVKGGLLKTRGGIKKAFKSLKRIGKRHKSDSSADEALSSPTKSFIKSGPPTPSPLVLESPALRERVFFPEDKTTPERRKRVSDVRTTKNTSFWIRNRDAFFQFTCGLICIVIANGMTLILVEETWRWNVDPFPFLPSVLFAFGIVLVMSSVLSCRDR